MNFWEKITGSDITRVIKTFELRVEKLPSAYQVAWEKINENLWQYSNFTGRNLLPIFAGVLDFLEEASLNDLSIEEVLGDNINDFCLELVKEEGVMSVRDKWREKLNNDIAKKLNKIGG